MRRGYLHRQKLYKNASKHIHLLTILQKLKQVYRLHRERLKNPGKVVVIDSNSSDPFSLAGLTLHSKAKHAINMLHNGTMISHYIKSCEYLLTYTNYSKEICELFVIGTQSAIILFRLLQTCNRSTPHQELLK